MRIVINALTQKAIFFNVQVFEVAIDENIQSSCSMHTKKRGFVREKSP